MHTRKILLLCLAVLLIPEIWIETFTAGITSLWIRMEVISVLELPGNKMGWKQSSPKIRATEKNAKIDSDFGRFGFSPPSWLQLLLKLGMQLKRCSYGITEVHIPIKSPGSFPFTPRSVHDTLFNAIHKRTLYPNKRRLYKGPLHRELYFFYLYFTYHVEFMETNLSFRPPQHRDNRKIT